MCVVSLTLCADFMWDERRDARYDLMQLGSDAGFTGQCGGRCVGARTLGHARQESGLDNAPMYDGIDGPALGNEHILGTPGAAEWCGEPLPHMTPTSALAHSQSASRTPPFPPCPIARPPRVPLLTPQPSNPSQVRLRSPDLQRDHRPRQLSRCGHECSVCDGL